MRSKLTKKFRSVERQLRRITKQQRTKTIYLYGSLGVLLVTTVFWAILGAKLHSTNADQLVDGYLFTDWQSFMNARFPGAHSMLLKWPIFGLVGIFGASSMSLVIATVAITLATVVGLAWLLSRIEKRPLVLGTWCLVLSSVLLLVPLQPYSGGLLPVQMAMLTTRNIEYLIYIIAIAFVLYSKRLISFSMAIGTILLTLVITSDRLFAGLGLGGAALMLLLGFIRQNRLITKPALRLLGAVAAASAVSVGLFAVLRVFGVTLFTSSEASPYKLVQSASSGVLGLLYGVLGIFTNFGANPSFDALTIRDLFSKGFGRLLSIYGLIYVFNISVASFVAWQSVKLVRQIPKTASKKTKKAYPLAPLVSLALLCSATVALGLFVVTNHYYAVDARYLTIWLFAGLIAAATTTRAQTFRHERVFAVGVLIALLIPLGMSAAWASYRSQTTTYDTIRTRDQKIADIMQDQGITKLVGDYWRVLPIRSASKQQITIAPLASCTEFRDTLTSLSWEKKLEHHRVALLISLEKGLTDFSACTQAEMIAHFGEPSSSIQIAGSASAPTELLLVYDKGFRHSAPVPSLSSYVSPVCPTKTILQVAAHPDDDLLFFSPDLIHDIQAGSCIRTVYVTAGDSGADSHYWRERQAGIREAYNTMLGHEYEWGGRSVRLSSGQQIQIDTPSGNTQITLIFMNLPDGGQNGIGYAATAGQSLQKLLNGTISKTESIDSHSPYNTTQLTDALAQLLRYYTPAEVRTFAGIEPDHSDHFAVAELTRAALSGSDPSTPLRTYMGYAVHTMLPNIEGDDFIAKETAFLRYAAHDSATCRDAETCFSHTAYGTYLARQYPLDY